MKRHFIVFYVIQTKKENGEWFITNGDLAMPTGEKYVNRKNITSLVLNSIDDENIRKSSVVLITNIIEVNEKEFYEYNN